MQWGEGKTLSYTVEMPHVAASIRMRFQILRVEIEASEIMRRISTRISTRTGAVPRSPLHREGLERRFRRGMCGGLPAVGNAHDLDRVTVPIGPRRRLQ